MAAKTNELELILREHRFSVTKQRRLIFDLLTDQEPMTMYELYDRARGRLDRASTYRIVTLFEKLCIVQRINIGWKYKIELSDKFAEHHHHLTCLKCRRVIPISEGELENFIQCLAVTHEFRPIEHQVEVQGYCGGCAVELPT
jgi:Fur family ferric uptake transcriptional regulator